jgi:GDPmannose 4,6-dehydratase
VNYRESYGLLVATAILFNHESPLRPGGFVTRKITSGVAAIALGRQDSLTLGRTDVRRDWGAASDYVEAMRLAVGRDVPDDYCVATGVSHSLAEFVEMAFAAAGLSDGMDRVVSDPALRRPADVPETRGDPSKAQALLGWAPRRPFADVVGWMIRADLRRLETGREHDPSYLE